MIETRDDLREALAREEWRKLPSVPQYEVSNFGRVRRAERGNVLRNKITKRGYAALCLGNGPKKVHARVHRIVVEAWIGEIPPMMQVNHIDGNKLNNHLRNLEVISAVENVRHAARIGLMPTGSRNGARTKPENLCRGERVITAKLTADAVRDIRARRARGEPIKDIAIRHGITPRYTRTLIVRKRWSHI